MKSADSTATPVTPERARNCVYNGSLDHFRARGGVDMVRDAKALTLVSQPPNKFAIHSHEKVLGFSVVKKLSDWMEYMLLTSCAV